MDAVNLRPDAGAGMAPAGVGPAGTDPAGAGPEGADSPLHAWIRTHDDRWSFIVLYIGSAVVLSIWISLFWLVAVVAGHLAIEYVRQRRLRPPGPAIVEALWEIKLDAALVLMALALSLYMEVIMGIVGLQAASRAGTVSRVGARFAGWQRVLRGILLSADDAAQVVRVAVGNGREGADSAAPTAPARSPWGRWVEPWPAGAWFACGLGVCCLVLITAAPALTPHSFASAVQAIASELRPFP